MRRKDRKGRRVEEEEAVSFVHNAFYYPSVNSGSLGFSGGVEVESRPLLLRV